MLDVEEHSCPHGKWAWQQCRQCDVARDNRIRELEAELKAAKRRNCSAAQREVSK